MLHLKLLDEDTVSLRANSTAAVKLSLQCFTVSYKREALQLAQNWDGEHTKYRARKSNIGKISMLVLVPKLKVSVQLAKSLKIINSILPCSHI
jgi:hypothetical protein